MRAWTVIANAIVLAALPVLADDSSHDRLGLKLLQAISYADLVRVVAKRKCSNPAEASHPVCSKLDRVPNSFIERSALPYLKKHVSMAKAETALKFWTSPDGARINTFLVRYFSGQDPTLLSKSDVEKLDRFNKSEAGIALSSLTQDREANIAVLRAIGSYAP